MMTFESGSAAKRESAKCLVSAAAASRFGFDCFSPPSLEGQWLTIKCTRSPANIPETTNWSRVRRSGN